MRIKIQAQSQIVIIGAGIVGCSLAYHLARLGWKEVLVLNKGQLYDNNGSTTHAPGGVVPLNSSQVLTQLGSYSVELCTSLKTWQTDRSPFNLVGGIELARGPARWGRRPKRAAASALWAYESDRFRGY